LGLMTNGKQVIGYFDGATAGPHRRNQWDSSVKYRIP
jgi:hypothetical protein